MGPVLASALVATVPDPRAFKSGRNLAAWIGLVPRQNSSGGKERLGGITKQGDRYLRQMLVVGALAVIRYAQRHGTRRPWLVQLLARRTTKIAAVALANKTARMIWAIMTTRRALQRAESGICSGVGDTRDWEGQTRCNAPSGRHSETGKPSCARAPQSACFWSGPVSAKGIMASGHARRTNRSNTWPHRPRAHRIKKSLANGEPSTHGATRIFVAAR